MVSVFIFIISRVLGIRFWHRFPEYSGLVARVSLSLISPPFSIKIKHPKWKEYLIYGVKDNKDFEKCKKFKRIKN
jgi:hypothetical protein